MSHLGDEKPPLNGICHGAGRIRGAGAEFHLSCVWCCVTQPHQRPASLRQGHLGRSIHTESRELAERLPMLAVDVPEKLKSAVLSRRP